MGKSNLMTLLSFILLIVAVTMFMIFWEEPVERADTQDISSSENMESVSDLPQASQDEPAETIKVSKSDGSEFEMATTEASAVIPKNDNVKIQDVLFIGDSRTVGLSEYGGLKNADFFANVGMSVYNIYKKKVSVSTIGKVTLSELLSNKKYGRVYLMLGINELGYNYDKTVARYENLVEFIREKQPDAVIFVEANLHVTKSRSDRDKVINNKRINQFNMAISQLADGRNVRYLDANVLFDDADGNLSSDISGDSVHPYGKYYAEWGIWIMNQSALHM